MSPACCEERVSGSVRPKCGGGIVAETEVCGQGRQDGI